MTTTKLVKESKWRPSPLGLVDRFQQAIANFPQAEKRKMFGYPCCFLNGNMVSGLHQENWIVRLSENDRLKLEALGGKLFAPMAGRIMQEYRALPEDIINDLNELLRWLTCSFNFVNSLPAKVKLNSKRKQL